MIYNIRFRKLSYYIWQCMLTSSSQPSISPSISLIYSPKMSVLLVLFFKSFVLKSLHSPPRNQSFNAIHYLISFLLYHYHLHPSLFLLFNCKSSAISCHSILFSYLSFKFLEIGQISSTSRISFNP